MNNENLKEIQILEQQIQNIFVQKQNIQTQLNEITTALKEIEKSENTYKVVANIIVKKNKEELVKELKDKREVLELRLKSLDNQEESLRKKSQEIRDKK